jgi:nitrate/nitrite transporter NarK
MFVGAIGGAIGSPLAGAIFDARGSYFVAFLICTGLNVVAIILSIVLLRSRDKEAPVH